MKNNPNSDLLPDGLYDATITDAVDKVSQIKPDGTGGNEMMELVLEVFDFAGNSVPVTDYLLSKPNWQWKIRHLCESAHVDYERKDLPANEFVGRNVRVEIITQDDKKYGKQNRVKDYLPRTIGATITPKKADEDSDLIPF